MSIPDLIKTSRPGFWPTHLWFYLLPFAGREMFGTPAFWAGCVYVCFPLGILLYGWNDWGDVDSDATNPRKDSWLFGARPSGQLRRWLPWLIVATQIPFIAIFVWLAGPKMLAWFAAVVIANAAYNTCGTKALPVFDLLNQVGYLLIFVLASWLCDVPQLNHAAMSFCALFAMQSHLFGQLMDIEEDREAGRRSTAVVLGVALSKWLLVAIMAAELTIAYLFFERPTVALFMLAGTLFFAVDAIWGPKRYPLRFVQAFFVAWNLIVIATMYYVWRYDVFFSPIAGN